MPFYKSVKERRLALGLSQEQLAERLLPHLPIMTKKVLSKVENNQRKVTVDELPHFARALECSPLNLLDW